METTNSPITISLTAAGAKVFPYVNAAAAIPIRYAYTYLAAPADSSITPLLTDAAGHALVAIRAYPDGRETLMQTFDGNPNLLHSVLLGYGLVNWATRGLFIGEPAHLCQPAGRRRVHRQQPVGRRHAVQHRSGDDAADRPHQRERSDGRGRLADAARDGCGGGGGDGGVGCAAVTVTLSIADTAAVVVV